MQRKVFIALLLCLGALQMGFSQLPSSDSADNLLTSTDNAVEISENWSFYADEENQLYYIDFQNLKINLSNIVIKNEDGKVLLKDDVFDLPVNTIYELDFSQYGAGTYEVELHSFTEVVRKSIKVK